MEDPWGLPQAAGNIWLISATPTSINLPSNTFHQIHQLFSGRSPGTTGHGTDRSEARGPPETEGWPSVRSPERRESSEGSQTEKEEGVIGGWPEQEKFNEDEGTV